MRRTEIEMISISQNDLGMVFPKVFRCKGLHASLSSYGDKYGGINFTMGSRELAQAGRRTLWPINYLKKRKI
jgi:hypothetical protein